MTLLPPNSSQLQHDLETANQHALDVEQALRDLRTFKRNPPDNLLHWLVWEYGLEEILPYVSDLREAMRLGLQWQKVRGTPESLKLALRWLNFQGTVVEESPPGKHFFEYQLSLDRIPSSDEIPKILGVSDISSPVRARLSRLYHTYDVRKLTLSNGHFGQMLSDFSGLDHQGVKLSFGKSYDAAAKRPRSIITHNTQREITITKRLNQRFQTIEARHRVTPTTFSCSSLGWIGRWDTHRWSDDGYNMIGIAHSQGF